MVKYDNSEPCRRKFIKNSILASSGTLLFASIYSCSKDEEFVAEGDYGFLEGVASFDPSQSQVILWTRYTAAINENTPVEIILDVASEPDFNTNSIVASEIVQANPAKDYTIHVDLSGLESNTPYFYRFRNEFTNSVSPTGHTKTLPTASELSSIKLAVVSCSNFQSGYFNVYEAIAKSDVDILIHLGDYIYESSSSGSGSNANTIRLNRQHIPDKELTELNDYRSRYKQYRSDLQLQEAHRLKPFICVWDDHEIANNSHKDGAQGHQPNEGDYETRKANALQAWREYLPARTDQEDKIFRSFELGNLADLFMIDSRIIGRDIQLNYFNYTSSNIIDVQAVLGDINDNSRTMLGIEQKDWLISQIQASSKPWMVLASQVLFGRYFIPVELLEIVNELLSTGNIQLYAAYQIASAELRELKERILNGDPTVSNAERMRVETIVPYNLDAWDGYAFERDQILDAASGKKLIVVSGDTHNAWHSDLRDSSGTKTGSEFACPSITAPGIEDFLGSDPNTLDSFASAYLTLIDDLQYFNVYQRGFIKLELSENSVNCDWHFVDDISIMTDTNTVGYSAQEF